MNHKKWIDRTAGIIVALAVMVIIVDKIWATQYAWTGTAGVGKWATATNWTPNGTPGAVTDTVTFANKYPCTTATDILIGKLIINDTARLYGTGGISIRNTTVPIVINAYFWMGTGYASSQVTTTNQSTVSIGVNGILAGPGTYNMQPYANNIKITVPTVATVNSPIWCQNLSHTTDTVFVGKLNIGTADHRSRCILFSPITFYYADSVVCAAFLQEGSNIAGFKYLAGFSGAVITATSVNTHNTAGACTVTDSLYNSVWNVSGSWTNTATTSIIYPGTSTVNILNTATITSTAQPFYNFVCNAAGKTITFADIFCMKGNFTITAGKPVFASTARDSIYGDYANNLTGTDTLNRNSDSLWLGGSFTGNLRTKNDLSRSYLYGTALCNFTCNGATVNYFDVQGTTRAKQMKLIDRYHGRKTMVTRGTLNTNGMDCFSDSFLVVQDSIATVLGDTISSRKITFGASAKPINGTPLLLYFGLALADTMRDSLPTTVSLGNLSVKKTGSNLTFANKGRYDNVVITDGAIAFNAVTDTLRCDSLNWQATDSSYITAPIIIGKTAGFVCAAGAKFAFSATGKIIMPDCTEGTTSGNTTVVLTYPAECTATSHRRRPTLNCGLMISTGD